MISNLGKKTVTVQETIALPLAKDALPKLATSSAIDKLERKMCGIGAVKAGKGFILFISNEDIDDTIKIVDWLEKSRLLINSATETVKHEINKITRRWISWCYDDTYSCFIDSYHLLIPQEVCGFYCIGFIE